MDEFTAPGRIQILQTAISFIAGYWLRFLMIYQSNSQLETPPPLGYGKEGAKTLLTNHACQIFYAPREQEDAEAISRILGNTTFKTTSRSINSGGNGGGSRSISEASRALMLPQELREMPFEKELIFSCLRDSRFSFGVEIGQDSSDVIPSSSRLSLNGAFIIAHPAYPDGKSQGVAVITDALEFIWSPHEVQYLPADLDLSVCQAFCGAENDTRPF